MVFTSVAPLTEQMYYQIASAVTIITTCVAKATRTDI